MRVCPGLLPRALRLIQHQVVSGLGLPGNRLKAVSCGAPLLPGPRPWGGSEPLPNLCLCHQMQLPSANLPLLCGWPVEPEGQLGPGHLSPPAMSAEGVTNRELPPLSQDLISQGQSCALGSGPFLSERRMFLWWRFIGMLLPDCDLIPRSLGLT